MKKSRKTGDSMGLDIFAFSNIKWISEANGEPDIDHCKLFANGEYPLQNGGIQNGIYSFDEKLVLRAGSYSGYNVWRDSLAKLASYSSADEVQRLNLKGPFSELINFSDCEGVICAEISAKLAKDFASYSSIACNYDSEDFFALYQQWQKAFELAAQKGAVRFC
jgi:hypothetical protein